MHPSAAHEAKGSKMPKATARLETDLGSRYLQAMCKHFAHKVKVDYDETRGHAAMPDGRLDMHADADGINFEVVAEDLQALLKTRYIVDAHIVRFAFREKLMGLAWHSFE
jgi:uncharacterized protein